MRQGTCKHYNGSYHNTHCEAGVCYLEVTAEPRNINGLHFRQPCFVFSDEELAELNDGQRESYQNRGTCDKYAEPTREEIAEFNDVMEKLAERFIRTLPIISKVKAEHEGEDWQGTVECPECKGVLHLSHASYNGHVWGQCETDGCLSWME